MSPLVLQRLSQSANVEHEVSRLTNQTATLQAAQTHKQRLKDDPEVRKITTKVKIFFNFNSCIEIIKLTTSILRKTFVSIFNKIIYRHYFFMILFCCFMLYMPFQTGLYHEQEQSLIFLF